MVSVQWCACVYISACVSFVYSKFNMCYVIAMNGTSKFFNELEALADRSVRQNGLLI